MSTEIVCALISGGVTLLVSIGTWHFTARSDKEKSKNELKKEINTALDNHYARTKADMQEFRDELDALKDNVTQGNATVQNHVAVLEVKMDTLSDRVEKHNNVIERVFKLEQAVEDLKN